MGRASPRKVHRYSLEFKRQAVKLSQLEASRSRLWLTPWIFIPSCCRDGGKKCATAIFEGRVEWRL